MTESQESQESQETLGQILQRENLFLDEKGLVRWETTRFDHPRGWSRWKKLSNFLIVVWLEFFMTAISTAGTTAAEPASEEYGVSVTIGYFAFTTIYLIGQTMGGMLCSPISETYGRRTLYIVSCVVYCITNVLVGSVPSLAAVIIGRLVSGFVSAIPTNVAYGNIEDTYDFEARVWKVYWYTSVALSALSFGPIFASLVADTIGWYVLTLLCKSLLCKACTRESLLCLRIPKKSHKRPPLEKSPIHSNGKLKNRRWIFYIAAILSGISTGISFFLYESRETVLLDNHVQKLRSDSDVEMYTESRARTQSWRSLAKDCLYRPIELLIHEPLIMFCCGLCAIGYGLIYGLTEAVTIVYGPSGFGFSKVDASLAFIAVALGMLLDCLPRFYDQYLFKRYREQGREILPESKIRSFAIACPALAVGLWIFAWTIPPLVQDIHWVVSMVGLVLVGVATNDFEYVLFGYVTDSYPKYAASASASLTLLGRTLIASVFPLFTSKLYLSLGSNWATTIYAAGATLFLFTPVLFLGYGQRLRQRSSWAVQ